MSTPLTHTTARRADASPGLRERLNLDPSRWGVPVLAELGVAVALAAALGYLSQIVPIRMPQGGSVSLEMLPLVIVAVRRGVVPGVMAGLLYGLVQLTGAVGAPFVYHPLQAALDYPLAFAAVGLAGLIAVPRLGKGDRPWALAAAVGVGAAARLLCHFLSGLLFFASYAPGWEAPWLYSLTYNLLYLLPSALLTALLAWPLLVAYDAAFPGRAGA